MKYGLDTGLKNSKKWGSVWGPPSLPFLERQIILSDPKSVEYILKTNFENFVKGDWFNTKIYELFGNGIFAVDGLQWKRQRQTASHLFKVKELRNMVNIFSDHGHKLLKILQSKIGEELDFQDIFARVTLDSIGEIAFGVNLGSLKDESIPFARAFNKVQVSIGTRFNNPVVMLAGPFKKFLKSEQELEDGCKVINQFAYDLIQTRKMDSQLEEKTDLLSQYIKMRDEDGQPFSDRYLRDIIINFVTAGRDTTAETMTFVSYLLAQNPRVEAKLMEEIQTTLNGRDPDYETVKSMSYLTAVIDEALRLYPAVPYDPKYALEEATLPNGTIVPKGCTLLWSAYIMGRSEELWDNPMEFRPERWLGENGGIPVESINAIPFQLGPRICLGKNMAYLEMKMVIILLLQKFKLKVVENHPIETIPSVTIYAKYGVKLTIQSRENL